MAELNISNTWIGFHDAHRWRVVIDGNQTLEVSNTGLNIVGTITSSEAITSGSFTLPISNGGTGTFLSNNGTWATPPDTNTQLSSSTVISYVQNGTLTGITLKGSGTSAALSNEFSSNTQKTYINFSAISGSNDPGFIMHETSSSTDDSNKGVIHICPTDDNSSTGDYVTIHGSNDPETIKFYTDGKIVANSLVLNGSLIEAI